MVIVNCVEEYWEFVRCLRNDPLVQDGFIQNNVISSEDQKVYMERHWHSYFIGLIDNQPVGYVGCIDGDIRVCTDPKHQNKGIGKSLIDFIKTKYPSGYAKIKIDNLSSLKAFESCSFVKKYYILESE
jgi:GNAT superfamily N-acetyltransferase